VDQQGPPTYLPGDKITLVLQLEHEVNLIKVLSLTPLLQRAGLPPMTFHQLRHTAATILLLKNVNPKVVSEMLGHATIAITLDTYSHVLPNMQHSAVAAMEEAFS
jgi:integrase